MSDDNNERRREHPGKRFSQSIIHQNLDELTDQLDTEDPGSGHGTHDHNQIELYRHGGTTVSLFVFEQGGYIDDHSVEDGAVMIQVLEGKLCFQTRDAETHLHPEENEMISLEPGIEHSVQAEKPTRMLLTIMRD